MPDLPSFLDYSETDFKCTPKEEFGILGWLELFVKACGCIAGFGSLISLLTDAGARLDLYRTAQEFSTNSVIIVVILSVVLLTSILELPIKLKNGELCTIGFHFVCVFSHIFLLLASFIIVDPGQFIFVFGFMFLLANMIHLMWLLLRKRGDIIVDEEETGILATKNQLAFTIILCILYAFCVGLQVFIWLGNNFQGDHGI
eukprot:TRINITY_DN4274_c0_g1_i2.p1 TRINITY_DN4274_c0_g1~~TRINITY_DN4274_c0_g1_i2.p1  ORF type:complete len:201 (-),score=31.00 TRINITY_DN4274_c0_g1_i2:514-1116(-)